MSIKIQPNGFKLKQKEIDYSQECPLCGCSLELIASESEEIMDKYESMEGNVVKCGMCRRYFIEYEIGDYEYWCLVEIKKPTDAVLPSDEPIEYDLEKGTFVKPTELYSQNEWDKIQEIKQTIMGEFDKLDHVLKNKDHKQIFLNAIKKYIECE